MMQKQYTKDVEALCLDRKRVAVIGFRANIDRLIDRLMYAKHLNLVTSTIVNSPDPETGDFEIAIIVTDYPYEELPDNLRRIRHGIFYSQEMADILLPSVEALNQTDWMVIRALERKYLADTELNKERELLRIQVDSDITGKDAFYV